ncbi:polysaccharide biosynthesis tyrosine autokinase [Tianweitania sp. BSSL-BM11]|uniref:Polysaccharide biosynthesis tyrosine autokinase n=1 Tax=Tianweitania aestuarii TaxID=2814886 RepID=A0ABS5RQZ1_9HYPH|nr:polysaccharide biosynthesis tyrosine autokinase [Tianweitania aestuarii]MBS9719466.1 polysaccharide biosynthesis tyrosine autokinase [Tianweitania aestuarii]
MLDRVQSGELYERAELRPHVRALPSPDDAGQDQLLYSAPPHQTAGLDLLRLWSRLLHHRRLIGAFLAGGLLVGLGLFLAQTPLYRATMRIEISAPEARVVRDLEVVSATIDTRSFQSALETLKSRSVVQNAVTALDLANRADFLFPRPRLSFGVSPAEALKGIDDKQRLRMAIARVQAQLSVGLIRNTSILSLAYQDADPDTAEAIVRQIAASYLQQRAEQTSRASLLARQFVEEQVADVKEQLQHSEAELVDYASEHGIMAATEGEESLIEQKIRALNDGLAEAINERLAAESRVQLIDAGHGNQLQDVLGNEAVLEVRSRIADLSADYQQKLDTFKPDYPEMRKLRAQIGELEKQRSDLTDAVILSLRARHNEAVRREDQLSAKLAELENELSVYADKSIRYTILKREVDSQRAQHDNLVDKLNDLGVGAELKAQNAAVIDDALAQAEPVTPRLSRSLAICLLIAAGMAGFTIMILERLNNAFRTPRDVEAQLKLPVLSALPNTDKALLEAQLADNRSPLGEAYRSLRTALQFADDAGHPRSLLVTSTEAGEGKTTTAHKIAVDFAALGYRVLLVDADLRRPTLHRRLKLPNRLGLSDILARRVTRESFGRMFYVAAPNLNVLTAGPTVSNPVDLLSSPRTGILLGAFLRRYDLVVIDGPPVTGLSDAPILSRLADDTLMVVSARQVSRQSAWLALSRLRAAGGNVVGVAMTRFRAEDVEGFYACRYTTAGAGEKARPPARAAVEWDYFGERRLDKPGVVGLRDALNDLTRGWIAGVRRQRLPLFLTSRVWRSKQRKAYGSWSLRR